MGCVTSFQDIKIIPSIIEILEKAGVNYGASGEEESCCGYLAYLVGDKQTFSKAMNLYSETISKYKPKELLTTCAGCLKTFRDIYPMHGALNGYTVTHAVEMIERLIARRS